MRLLYLTDRLSDRGGADHHLAQVMSSAADSGHRVTVAFGRDELGGVAPRFATRRRVRGLASPVDTGSGLGSLDELLDDADLVHVHNVMNPTALAAVAGRGRVVVTIQDHRSFCPGPGKTLPDGSPCRRVMSDAACRICLADDGYRRRTLELTRRRLDALAGATIIVLSSYMADELAAVGRPDAVVLPPWLDIGPPGFAAGRGFVLGGRLVAHKGVIDGWRAWRRAGRPQPLVVAGAGPLADRLDGADRRGWLDPPALRRMLRGARALLFPARWQEPFGILGAEALAEGTPVIVAGSGGTGEWSSAGCLRVPPGDVNAMADAIRRLDGEPELASALGAAGREAVERRFGRRRIEPRLHDLYRRVVES